MSMKKIYLAIPYSGLEEKSFAVANEVAGELLKEGHVVYSPISHSHPIAKVSDLPKTWEFWSRIDREFISWCDTVVVVEIGSYGKKLIMTSMGCQAEIEMANELNKNIKYYQYNEI